MIAQIYEAFLKSTGVTTDTRTIEEGKIFFALKGENFNGNKFAAQAFEKGALAVVVDEEKYKLNEQCFLVDNVLETLQALASHHRDQFKIPIVAITGSNGKTTTKELMYWMLATQLNTFATKGNYNNHIGVPLSLLSIKQDTKVAIIEMGANHLGEIADYCKWAKPTHGFITNIGSAHLEGFGSHENIIKAKSELYESIKARKGIIFYNNDDVLLTSLLEDYEYKISYGCQGEVDTKVELESSFPTVSVKYNDNVYRSNLFGEYNFSNISAALALADYFDISHENLQLALQGYIPDNNRSEIKQVGSNLVILDAYNANPTSVKAAVKSYAQLGVANKMLFIGDMFELGKESQKLHQDIINYIESFDFEKVILVGKEFVKCNSKKGAIFIDTTTKAKEWFDNQNFQNCTFLIKGSRGMKMESLLK
ncbi:MAG: UDP-N-acetylmuramoyl-tripeptide--D-alanyl-D-alanine ligase [Chitinophagales bacterium]